MAIIGGLSIIEVKKLREDEVLTVIEDWSMAKKLITFKYLRASGVSMENIDHRINDALRQEMAKENK